MMSANPTKSSEFLSFGVVLSNQTNPKCEKSRPMTCAILCVLNPYIMVRWACSSDEGSHGLTTQCEEEVL